MATLLERKGGFKRKLGFRAGLSTISFSNHREMSLQVSIASSDKYYGGCSGPFGPGNSLRRTLIFN
jgi:hypothetical protein